jgi:hypothetical protein
VTCGRFRLRLRSSCASTFACSANRLGRANAARRVLPALSWRRSLLVLAPVCLLGLVSAALIHGLVSSGGSQNQALVQQTNGSGGTADTKGSKLELGTSAATPDARSLATPAPGRFQDYQASLTVRVKDVDTLHDRTAEATQIARSYGGFVASVDESTNGGGGQSDLVLRIPVARVQDAYFRLATLGTVTAQHLSIRDLDQVVKIQRRRIVQLKLSIARIGQTSRAPRCQPTFGCGSSCSGMPRSRSSHG